jgi:NAD(P)-dependent dehydrogenase (short-subunit alcohol dehydrogenase family)
MQRLSEKVAIVTGGAKGIGLGCVHVFASEGARVVIADKDEEAGKRAESDLSPVGEVWFAPTDVTSTDSVRSLMEAVAMRWGGIDVLLNNAGYHISKTVLETSEEEWDYILDTNLKSVFLCSKYALPSLMGRKGCIINMSSMVGLVGQSKAGAYSASKGGIVAMTKGMALDFAPHGVRVNCICPGWVATPLVEDWFGQQPDPEAARRYIYSVHPVGRIATAEEVGRAALFLATEDSSFVTGVALPVDGAVTLGY